MNEDIKNAAAELGMTFAGIDEDGEMEFIGTEEQWENFEEAKSILEDAHRMCVHND